MSNQYFQTIHQIITTGHWITHRMGQELKEFGITEPQYNVLRTLKEERGKPISVQEIQQKMVQRSSNVTRIIDKLLLKGCVGRHECPSNRRKMDITLTKTGEDLLRRLDTKVVKFHSPLQQRLTEEELETLQDLIKKLTADKND